MSVAERDPTLAEFWDMCKNHDWFYAMSDDGRVYRAGKANYEKLQRTAAFGGEAYTELLAGFSSHIFSGKPWKTEKQPMPERPSE